jgi:phosphoglycolate phosphatase-like HAD superfamily hydrolase
MTRLVLFDIDDTLIQTNGAGPRAFDRAFEIEFEIKNATHEISFAGRTDRGILSEFLTNHSIPEKPGDFECFFRSYTFWLDYYLAQSPGNILPGVNRLLRELLGRNQRPAIGLLTGNIRLGAQIKLRRHRLWNFFETGAFGCEHHDRNQIAEIALKRGQKILGKNLRGSEILVIGDTTLDIDCANAISARSLAVATGGSTLDDLAAHQPTWAVENLSGVNPQQILE